MRVLIASDSFAPSAGVAAETAAMLTSQLLCRGHDVEVIAPTAGTGGMSRARVHRQLSLPRPGAGGERLGLPLPCLRPLIARLRPDVAISLTAGPIAAAVTLALPRSTPLIDLQGITQAHAPSSSCLGLLRGPAARLSAWINARATVTLCPTRHILEGLAARAFTRLELWSSGVDHDVFSPKRRTAEMRRRLSGGEPEKPLVLYAGTLTTAERVDDLHRAARMLPGVRFAIVGDGPDRQRLERRFADVPSVFTGELRGAHLAEALASADIFGLPGSTELCGRPVLQVMASGVPSVVAEGTAPAELVPDGVAGLQVPARDTAALVRALRSLASEPGRRLEMGAAAARLSQAHSWEALTDELEERYLRGACCQGWETLRSRRADARAYGKHAPL